MWFDIFTDEMKELEFFQSHYDFSLYLNHNDTYIAVCVNEIQIVGLDLDFINCVKTNLT